MRSLGRVSLKTSLGLHGGAAVGPSARWKRSEGQYGRLSPKAVFTQQFSRSAFRSACGACQASQTLYKTRLPAQIRQYMLATVHARRKRHARRTPRTSRRTRPSVHTSLERPGGSAFGHRPDARARPAAGPAGNTDMTSRCRLNSRRRGPAACTHAGEQRLHARGRGQGGRWPSRRAGRVVVFKAHRAAHLRRAFSRCWRRWPRGEPAREHRVSGRGCQGGSERSISEARRLSRQGIAALIKAAQGAQRFAGCNRVVSA